MSSQSEAPLPQLGSQGSTPWRSSSGPVRTQSGLEAVTEWWNQVSIGVNDFWQSAAGSIAGAGNAARPPRPPDAPCNGCGGGHSPSPPLYGAGASYPEGNGGSSPYYGGARAETRSMEPSRYSRDGRDAWGQDQGYPPVKPTPSARGDSGQDNRRYFPAKPGGTTTSARREPSWDQSNGFGAPYGGPHGSASVDYGPGFDGSIASRSTAPTNNEYGSTYGPRGGRPPSDGGRSTKPERYEVDKEDLLDQHVGYYLRHHPTVYQNHTIVRKRPGAYELDGREIKVEWQYATEPGGQGFLVAVDGPLRQPFADYMEMTEANAEYDKTGIRSASALHAIPKDKRMSFHDQHKMYSRLEAMKVAKEQALVREKHADYLKDGKDAPVDLMHKYKKNIQQKLDPGGRRSSRLREQQQQLESQQQHQQQAVHPGQPPPMPAPAPPPHAAGSAHGPPPGYGADMGGPPLADPAPYAGAGGGQDPKWFPPYGAPMPQQQPAGPPLQSSGGTATVPPPPLSWQPPARAPTGGPASLTPPNLFGAVPPMGAQGPCHATASWPLGGVPQHPAPGAQQPYPWGMY